ncbi:hypothetical protein AB0D97_12695 [Streptomyces roseus]|uniref:hypothetical protein n=1 Tax=Streptomyces roseus TaxID=66430 RepID=UPI0033D3EE11
MTVQPPLFLPGWDVEPCDTAPPDPAPVETRYGHGLDQPDDRPRHIPGDHGQPPGRRRELEPRTIHNIRVKGGLL